MRGRWVWALALWGLLPLRALAREAGSGAEVWQRRCAMCHGDDGRGRTAFSQQFPVPDFTSPDWQSTHSDPQIRGAILNGHPERNMPAWKGRLSNSQIESLVALVRSFRKTPRPPRPEP